MTGDHLTQLRSSNPTNRTLASMLMGLREEPLDNTEINALKKAALEDSNPIVRKNAAESLIQKKVPGVLETLIDRLENEDTHFMMAVTRAFGDAGVEKETDTAMLEKVYAKLERYLHPQGKSSYAGKLRALITERLSVLRSVGDMKRSGPSPTRTVSQGKLKRWFIFFILFEFSSVLNILYTNYERLKFSHDKLNVETLMAYRMMRRFVECKIFYTIHRIFNLSSLPEDF